MEEEAVALVAAERVGVPFAVGGLADEVVAVALLLPEVGVGEAFGHGRVIAHDRAPEAASGVDVGGDLGWCGVVAGGDVEVEVAVVIEVAPLAAVGPAGAVGAEGF